MRVQFIFNHPYYKVLGNNKGLPRNNNNRTETGNKWETEINKRKTRIA